MTRLALFLPIVALLLMTSKCLAAEEGVHTRIHHQYQSTRALGMGDAFVAQANDYTAIFYNPAGLARRDSGLINLSLFEGGFSQQFLEFKNDADKVGKDTQGMSDSAKFDAYSAFLGKHYGKTFQIRTKFLESFYVKENWGIALIPLDLTVEYQIRNQVSPAMNVRAFADTTLAYGYGTDIKGVVPGRLSVGTTVKFINRGYANQAFSALDLSADKETVKKEDLRDGYTADFDVGTLYTPEIPNDGFWSIFNLAKPTFGAVIRNVLDYGFGQTFNLINDKQQAAPEKLNRVLDVGAKFEYPEIWIFSGRGSVDFRDIFHPNVSLRKSFHLGFEFDWTVSNWWRGHYRLGLNQGYPSFGVSALLFWFNLDAAVYAEDVGTYNSPKANRMYILKLNMDI